MPINPELRDEIGKVIAGFDDSNPTWLLDKWLPDENDDRFVWLQTIDPYGDTTFNPIQAQRLLPEWDLLIAEAGDEEKRGHLTRIRALTEECAENIHVYLWFVGD